MKRIKWFFYLFIIFTFVSNNSFACRYTVREIGFSDIGTKTYNLFFFTDSLTPEEQVVNIRKYSNILLRDTNVRMDIINIVENKSSPDLKFLSQYNNQTYPFAVLIAPNGESMACSYTKSEHSMLESSWYLLESLVSSTFREDLISRLIRSYGVVLIIEGTDSDENKRVKNAAREAVKTITGSFNQMPKIVNQPPEIMVIPHNKKDDEKILLFGLGINEKNKNDTHVAIVFGRGKLAGPMMTCGQITTRRIYNLLTLIGADCECGIDNSWLIGEMIPLRWSSSEQDELIKQLGFDVENPFVKTEMSQIISLKAIVENPINPLEENLLGFVEGSFEISNASNAIPKISAAEIQKSFSHGNQPKNNLILKKMLVTIGLIFLIVAITGFSILIFHKRRTT